ncbi:MAG: HEAT repeat domain-containing protein [Candidatus Omnitrophica bacterium]|nr:HEAT repeat domain-containing protein [Candidatus Omnitrophota bacterium]
MFKRKKYFLIVTITILLSCIFLYYIGAFVFWNLVSLQGLDYWHEFKNELNTVSSEVLIKKINIFDFFSPYPEYSFEILAERKEKKAVLFFIEIVKRKNHRFRSSAIWALGEIGDNRGIAPLMDIVRQGKKQTDYLEALSALSKMKCEEAFPYVLELTKDKDAYSNGSVSLLRLFGKVDTIPVLLTLKKNIKADGSLVSRIALGQIDEAIAHLESIKKEQEEQKSQEP